MSDYQDLRLEPTAHRFPAWLGSCLFHLVLFTAIGSLARRENLGTGGQIDRPIGIAMVERLPDRTLYTPASTPDREIATPDQAAEVSASASAAAIAPATTSPPVDLDGMLAEMIAGDLPSVGSNDVQGAFGSGVGNSPQGSKLGLANKATTAMVFSVSGSGSRFVYVFDRSDSMNGFGGRPLRAAKNELKRSIRSLTEGQQFQIVFYNDEAKAFVPAGSPLRLLVGEKSMIQRAVGYIDAIKAFGGTEHFDALRMALRMGPDVIFFLTDARVPRLSGIQIAEVKRMAERAGTTIHTIEFGTDAFSADDSFLRELAASNRGEYRYIPVDELTNGALSKPLESDHPNTVP